jgi:hypothetical protein
MDFSLFEFRRTELTVLLGVVALVGTLSVFQIKIGEMKTRDTQRKDDVSQLLRRIQKYQDDHKVLPKGDSQGRILACGSSFAEPCEWGNSTIIDEIGVVYVTGLPKDPRSYEGRTYRYEVFPEGLRFRIYTALEDLSDRERRKNLTLECGMNVQCNWYVGNRE